MKGRLEPFRWHAVGNQRGEVNLRMCADFAALGIDVAAGTRAVLELLHANSLQQFEGDDGSGESVLPLGPDATERLLRLAIAASEMFSERSEQHLEWIRRQAAGRAT